MIHNYRGVTDSKSFNKVIEKLRNFFKSKGFVEVHTQDRLSILAACEDPSTVATFEYAGEVWPLPQTGQMWLEHELLTNPTWPGVFTVSTSYRAEKNPIPGRHKIIFPMFEFESRGTLDDLRKLEGELLEYLGFGSRDSFVHKSYDELANFYNTKNLSHEHENKMEYDFGQALFLENFPITTSPFWNMQKNVDHANKIDIILGGAYAQKLYDLFGRERVQKELDEFLSLKFFPRYGGGIGVTRMMDAMGKYGLID